MIWIALLAFFGLVLGDNTLRGEGWWIGAVVGALVGAVIALRSDGKAALSRVAALEVELSHLRWRLDAADGRAMRKAAEPIEPPGAADPGASPPGQAADASRPESVGAQPSEEPPPIEALVAFQSNAAGTDTGSGEAPGVAARSATEAELPGVSVPESSRTSVASIVDVLRELVFGGNTVVRVGIVVLLVGVTLLLRWAAENSKFPIELRMLGAALIGLALIVTGYLSRRRRGFGLTLQGGGIATTYLVVFFSYRVYELLPAPLAFGLLAGVAASAIGLALAQDAKALIVIGQAGGFLAPVLASTGSGNHVALFSYYLLLNVAIFAVALKKAWRELNLLGFLFTFGVGTVWGALDYRAEHFATTEPFLGLFFLLYVAIPILYAARHPGAARGIVDGSLVFGTPLTVVLLQGALVEDIELGMAFSALAMGVVYATTASFLWRRSRERFRGLVEAHLALAVGFGTLAIPFALDDEPLIGAAWALEGAGLYWVGVRQGRRLSRAAGVLLQLGAGVALSLGGHFTTELAFANARFVSALLVAGAAWFVAAYAWRSRERLLPWEPNLLQVLLFWGVGFWAFAGEPELRRLGLSEDQSALELAWLGATCLLLEWIGARARHEPARWLALGSFVLILIGALEAGNDAQRSHPLAGFGLLAWTLLFGAVAQSLGRFFPTRERWLGPAWALGLFLFAGFLSLEAYLAVLGPLGLGPDWAAAASLTVLGVALLGTRSLPPRSGSNRGGSAAFAVLAGHRALIARLAGLGLALVTCLVAAANTFVTTGDVSPLPYVPGLNPLDVSLVFALLAVVALRNAAELSGAPLVGSYREGLTVVTAGTAFLAFNGLLARSVHQYTGVPMQQDALFDSVAFQVALTVSWSILAVALMTLATRRASRPLWLVATSGLGVTVLKLFVVDLSQLSAVARIGTFLIVGLLVLVVGYFSPLPPPASGAAHARTRRASGDGDEPAGNADANTGGGSTA